MVKRKRVALPSEHEHEQRFPRLSNMTIKMVKKVYKKRDSKNALKKVSYFQRD
jgi:hypothetical protein